MDNPKISVIVPVYNVEQYLLRCINSILAQTFTDFELLLIDDGSTDNSGRICDEYAKKDNRIRVFHKENGGVSSARNVGLANAQGGWLWFVDSDDYLEQNALDIVILHLKYNDAEIYEYSFKRGDRVIHILNKREKNIVGNDAIMRFFLDTPKFHLWNKIIRKDVIKDTFFQSNISIGEDFLFLLVIFNRINTYKYVDQVIYNYMDSRADSATNALSMDRYFNEMVGIVNFIKESKNFYSIENYIAIPSVFINKKRLRPKKKDKLFFLLMDFWNNVSLIDILKANVSKKKKIYILVYKLFSIFY